MDIGRVVFPLGRIYASMPSVGCTSERLAGLMERR
jgi:hypothetical protein